MRCIECTITQALCSKCNAVQSNQQCLPTACLDATCTAGTCAMHVYEGKNQLFVCIHETRSVTQTDNSKVIGSCIYCKCREKQCHDSTTKFSFLTRCHVQNILAFWTEEQHEEQETFSRICTLECHTAKPFPCLQLPQYKRKKAIRLHKLLKIYLHTFKRIKHVVRRITVHSLERTTEWGFTECIPWNIKADYSRSNVQILTSQIICIKHQRQILPASRNV